MKIYNTLTRKKEDFKPVKEDKVGIYVCGPTVYNYIHIGNARPIVVFDTLRRYFLYRGYDVKYVQNFTDIDDKIIDKANQEGVEIQDISEKYIEAFLEDTAELNILDSHTIHPKATEYIEEMITFVQGLEDKGAAYNVDGNVYFDISKVEDYGKLSKKNIDELQAGARVARDEDKKNPMDFSLWKKSKEREPYWQSPWGEGRPGWHLECSVMSQNIIGDTIDIHAGGEDLEFPHHENEIAQSETLTGKTFANYWMHNGMINVDNTKMSKSSGNFFLLREILEEYDGEVIRFWLLSAHYRSPINFSSDVMESTKASLERLYNGKEKILRLEKSNQEGELDKDLSEKVNSFKDAFIKAMDDDLNTADGISVIFELVSLINTEIDESTSLENVQEAKEVLLELAEVLGFLYKDSSGESLDDRVEALIEERNQARANKDYAKADEIRDQLLAEGIELKDTSTGVVWKRI